MQTCTICFCDGPVAQGVCCAERHYTCGDCFEAYVRSEAGKPLGELKKRDGRVVCPSNTDAMKGADRCHAPPFADKDIASNVSDEAFEAYLRAREKLKEETMAEEMRTEMERRVELERERAAAGAGAAEKLRAAKEHIIENILTLCCPRCKQAFVDFDGCFALSCSRCGAGFCAYCLADCGRDAHQHVGTCPEGIASVKASKTTRRVGGYPPTVYGSKEAFEVSQKRRRCKHLALYLERHDAKTRDALLTSLKKELDDLKITAKDVKHWQNKEAKAIADRERRQAPRGGARRGGGGGGGGGMDAIRAAAHAAAHAALMRGRRHIGEFLGGFQTWKMTTTISRGGGGARPARGGARRRRDAAFDPVEARARLRRAGFAPGPPGVSARATMTWRIFSRRGSTCARRGSDPVTVRVSVRTKVCSPEKTRRGCSARYDALARNGARGRRRNARRARDGWNTSISSRTRTRPRRDTRRDPRAVGGGSGTAKGTRGTCAT